ncbi:MAG: YkgJ family cysteine cluster protein [Candidatus Lokiarchaeota archaeon]|nr:YkgJ family cysteine cluster protein [Candidatus Lokiarchaeota archaeon]
MTNVCLDCGKCCLETEMILSQEDVKRIINNFEGEIEQEDFCNISSDGFLQLRNNDHHCYFFDTLTKTCIIYDTRPQGCKFYPLIYNMKEDKCVLDEDCPKPSVFYPNINERKKTCLEIIKFLKNQLKINF